MALSDLLSQLTQQFPQKLPSPSALLRQPITNLVLGAAQVAQGVSTIPQQVKNAAYIATQQNPLLDITPTTEKNMMRYRELYPNDKSIKTAQDALLLASPYTQKSTFSRLAKDPSALFGIPNFIEGPLHTKMGPIYPYKEYKPQPINMVPQAQAAEGTTAPPSPEPANRLYNAINPLDVQKRIAGAIARFVAGQFYDSTTGKVFPKSMLRSENMPDWNRISKEKKMSSQDLEKMLPLVMLTSGDVQGLGGKAVESAQALKDAMKTPKFHVGDLNPHPGVLGQGIYVADTADDVARYAEGQNAVAKQFSINPDIKMLDLRDPNKLTRFTSEAINDNRAFYNKMLADKGDFEALSEVMSRAAKQRGYDGIMGDSKAFGTVIFDPKNIVSPGSMVKPLIAGQMRLTPSPERFDISLGMPVNQMTDKQLEEVTKAAGEQPIFISTPTGNHYFKNSVDLITGVHGNPARTAPLATEGFPSGAVTPTAQSFTNRAKFRKWQEGGIDFNAPIGEPKMRDITDLKEWEALNRELGSAIQPSSKQTQWIVDQIYNNEESPQAMKKYLMSEGGITEDMADRAVATRDWMANQTHVVTHDELAKKLLQPQKGIIDKTFDIKRVADNLQKNNPGLARPEAEAMARDVISNRPFNAPVGGKVSDAGATDSYSSSLRQMREKGKPLMADEQKWLGGDYSDIEKQAKNLYGTTKNPDESLYIAKDGKMIGNKGVGSAEHRDFAMELTGQSDDTSLLPKRSGFVETVYSPGAEYNVRIFTDPTPEQIKTINNVSKTVPSINVDDYRGGDVKSYTFDKKTIEDFLSQLRDSSKTMPRFINNILNRKR